MARGMTLAISFGLALVLCAGVLSANSMYYGAGDSAQSSTATVYNHLTAINPTQPFQPVVSSLGCASAQFSIGKLEGESTFFLLHGSCFAGEESEATWLYAVGPNTWYRSESIFSNSTPPARRQDHVIATLHNASGVVLFGGRSGSNASTATLFSDAWLYRGDELQWQALESVQTSPLRRYAASMAGCTMTRGCSAVNAAVYLFGGLSAPAGHAGTTPTMLNDLWRLDVDEVAATARWTEMTPMPDVKHGMPPVRGFQHATVASGGDIYVCGGLQYAPDGKIHYLLDLWRLSLSNTSAFAASWHRLGDIAIHIEPYDSCSVAGLSYVPLEGDVSATLIALLSCSSALEMRVWSYTITTDHWEEVWYVKGDSLPPPFVQPITQGHSEQVYIYGGIDSQSRVYTGLWVLRYNTRESTCVQAAAPDILPPIVSQHAASYLPSTRMLYVYGGVYPTAPAMPGLQPTSVNIADTRLHMYNAHDAMWTSVLRPGAARLAGHSMVAWRDDLYVFGGFAPGGASQAALWRFDIADLAWSNATAPPSVRARQSHAAALDEAAGRMYVFGGLYTDEAHAVQVLSDLLVHDLARGTWSEVTALGTVLPPAVFGHSMVFIDEQLYVLGGATINSTGGVHTVSVVEDMFWRFDLRTHKWENLCYWVTPGLFHPLLAGRFFTTAAAKDTSLMMFVGDCCESVCTVRASDLPYGVALNTHTIAQRCCSRTESAVHPRVWLLATVEQTWMEVDMTYSASAHLSPIRHAGHSLTSVDDAFYVHGGLCHGEQDNTLCSLALPTYTVQPGCNAGWYSDRVFTQACQPCPEANFSALAGGVACQACPLGSFAPRNGSTSQLQCSLCPRDMCNDAGDCAVNSVTGAMDCDCDFGYAGGERCRVPSVYLGIGGAALFIALLTLLSCVLVQKYRAKRGQDEEKERQLRTCKREIANLNSVWRIEDEELRLVRRIDADTPGTFGEVWVAVYRDMQVAVKQLRTHVLVADAHALVEFQREAEFMRTIRHPHIVLFLGAGVVGPSAPGAASVPFLVVEYMSRGTLMSVLGDKTCHVDHQQRLRMALDVAKGMRFLHGLTPPRVHRDLKSANLLVSEHFVVKVSDFGSARWIRSIEECQQSSSLSRSASSVNSTPLNAGILSSRSRSYSDTRDTEHTPLLSPDAMMSSDVGTLLWSAPEVLAQRSYGAAADVFSYSIVLWELYTRKEPYCHTALRFSFEYAKFIMEGGRPEMEAGWPKDYRQLVEQCWVEEAERRPKFDDIVPSLDYQLERCFAPT